MDTQSLKDKPLTLTQEQKDAVAKSMARAGIASRYHEGRSLTEFGTAGKAILKEMDSPEFLEFIYSGGGFSITGLDPNKVYDYSILTARAMRIMQIDTRVVNLISLSRYLSGDEEIEDRFKHFETTRALMVMRFAEPMDKMPLSRNEFYKMENFLYSLLEDEISISVQYSGKLENGWWSDYFIKRLKAANKEFSVK